MRFREDADDESILSEVHRLLQQRLPSAEAELVTRGYRQLFGQLRPLKAMSLRDSEPAPRFDPRANWGPNELS